MAATTCRVCLENGASYPIFDSEESEDSVHEKLNKCFKEKVKDVLGLPRNICLQCKDTLNTLCHFISKFKESQKILEGGLLLLKQENRETSEAEHEYSSDVEIEIKTDKEAPDYVNFETIENDQLLDLLQPLPEVKKIITFLPDTDVKTKIKKESFGRKKLYGLKALKNSTSKVASSILEGKFSWNGENWCLKSTTLKNPKENPKKGKRRDTRLKLPRKKTIFQSKLCDLCGDTFKSQYKLSMHRKKFHCENPVECPHCPKICTTNYNLNRHIKRKHSQSRDYICSTCGNSFAFKGELTNHTKKVHSGMITKKIYTCKFCEKTYKCQKSVLVHERSAHTGERPAVCTICNKGFFHEEYLAEHMRLHTGEAPFKCPVCDRGYAQRGNMKSHLRVHRISELDSITLSKIKPNYLKLLKH